MSINAPEEAEINRREGSCRASRGPARGPRARRACPGNRGGRGLRARGGGRRPRLHRSPNPSRWSAGCCVPQNRRRYRVTVADELAALRHTAQKRYYEWWENCNDAPRFAEGEKAAEDMRLKIIEKLRKEVNAAEADYFNTPRMYEPFPANRTLVQCPKAPLINEFGYRVQRLGGIIQRLLLGLIASGPGATGRQMAGGERGADTHAPRLLGDTSVPGDRAHPGPISLPLGSRNESGRRQFGSIAAISRPIAPFSSTAAWTWSPFKEPESYFHQYAALSDEAAERTAGAIWDTINGPIPGRTVNIDASEPMLTSSKALARQ